MNGPTGLDYAGVEALGRLRGEPLDPEMFSTLQICEHSALTALAEIAGERDRERQHGR